MDLNFKDQSNLKIWLSVFIFFTALHESTVDGAKETLAYTVLISKKNKK